MYTYRVEWPGPDGSTRVYSGHRPTPEAAFRARIAKILELAERYPKRRSVLVRSA